MANPRDKGNLGSLNSWKEISAYLDRGVRTVQRWERELALPIHRIGRGPKSPVHAFPSELQAWMLRIGKEHAEIIAGPGRSNRPFTDGSIAASRVLVTRSSALVSQMVQSLWIQRRRAEDLMRVMEDVQRHMHKHLGHNALPSPTSGTNGQGSTRLVKKQKAGAARIAARKSNPT